MRHAFYDSSDGYYEIEVPDGGYLPDWTNALTPCAVATIQGSAPTQTVSPWQIRKALNHDGLRDAVESAVSASDQTTKDGWEFATEFRRDDPLVVSIGAALSKTEAEMNNIFSLAATL